MQRGQDNEGDSLRPTCLSSIGFKPSWKRVTGISGSFLSLSFFNHYGWVVGETFPKREEKFACSVLAAALERLPLKGSS